MTTIKKNYCRRRFKRLGFNFTFCSSFEITNLRSFWWAAEDASVARHWLNKGTEFFGNRLNLLSKLTGWSENEDDRSFTARQRALVVDVNQTGQHVSERLSWSCHGDSEQITTWQCNRPSLSLNWRRRGESLLCELVQDDGREVGFDEILMGERNFSPIDSDCHLFTPCGNLFHRSGLVVFVELVEVLHEWLKCHRLPVWSDEILSWTLCLHALQLGAIFLRHIIQVGWVAFHSIFGPAKVLLWWVGTFHEAAGVETAIHETGVELVVELIVSRVSVPVWFLAAVVEIWTWSKAETGESSENVRNTTKRNGKNKRKSSRNFPFSWIIRKRNQHNWNEISVRHKWARLDELGSVLQTNFADSKVYENYWLANGAKKKNVMSWNEIARKQTGKFFGSARDDAI